MASNSTIGLGLIAVALMFFSAGYGWMGIGLVMIGVVMLATRKKKLVVRIPQPVPAPSAAPAPKSKPQWMLDAEQEAKMATVEDLKLRPSVPPDSIAGIGSIGPKESPVTIGKRTGTLSIYTADNRVRFKDDLRFNPEFMDTAPDALKRLVTTHFRTRKPIFYQPTKCLESTFESWDKELWDHRGWDIDM